MVQNQSKNEWETVSFEDRIGNIDWLKNVIWDEYSEDPSTNSNLSETKPENNLT